MCLQYLHKNDSIPETGTFYKAFIKNQNGNYAGVWYSPSGNWVFDFQNTRIYRKDVWYESTEGVIRTSEGLLYQKGFHGFALMRSANDYAFALTCSGYHVVVCECEYDGIQAIGSERTDEVIVARKIKIVEEL